MILKLIHVVPIVVIVRTKLDQPVRLGKLVTGPPTGPINPQKLVEEWKIWS